MIGIICGIITGVGMGGGSILIVILTTFLQVEQHLAQASNLFFYIPTSIAALMVYLREKNIDTVMGQQLLFSVILGAFGGAFLTKYMDSNHLKRYFAVFVFLVGIVDLISIIRKMMKKKGSKEKQ